MLKLGIFSLLLLSINLLGVYRWRKFSIAEKFIAVLIWVDMAVELVSYYAAYYWHNNSPISHIYSLVEFLIISLYFNKSIDAFRKRDIGVVIGISGMVLGLLNTFFIQKITSINSYFLLFEGTFIIIYCLLSFHQLLMNEEHLPYRYAHFWITCCFMLFWSVTFTCWGIYAVIEKEGSVFVRIFNIVNTGANYVFYLGIGAVFLWYKKLIPSGA